MNPPLTCVKKTMCSFRQWTEEVYGLSVLTDKKIIRDGKQIMNIPLFSLCWGSASPPLHRQPVLS